MCTADPHLHEARYRLDCLVGFIKSFSPCICGAIRGLNILWVLGQKCHDVLGGPI